jgi:hypothetical protein
MPQVAHAKISVVRLVLGIFNFGLLFKLYFGSKSDEQQKLNFHASKGNDKETKDVNARRLELFESSLGCAGDRAGIWVEERS